MHFARGLRAALDFRIRMNAAIATLLVLSVVYAVLGNLAVYVILSRRRVPMRMMWVGTPMYLYSVCRNSPYAGASLRRFAASTNVAFVLALLLIVIASGNVHPN